VFESIANNLVSDDTNRSFDVFRHDRVTGETVRVSVATGGRQGTGASTDARMSDDGNRVVFTSAAFDLVDGDFNGATDIFLRDLAAGTTTRISISLIGGDTDLASTQPAISSDGRVVAFTSAATNLVAGDANTFADIFVRDLAAGTTTRVSVSTNGGEANQPSSSASLSHDGRFVAFLSSATNLVPRASGTTAYVRDMHDLTTTHPPVGASLGWAQLSTDGQYLAVVGSPVTGISICDRFAAKVSDLSGAPGSGTWTFPMFSGNSRYVAAIATAGGGSLIIAPNPL
jgi:Tol biopolymer transport system component